MKWISTRNRKIRVPFLEAIGRGLAPDGGLYVPESFPKVSKKEFQEFSDLSFAEVASRLAQKWLQEEWSSEIISKQTHAAFNFPIELKQLDDSLTLVELFHGPSFSFKDYGARFLAHFLSLLKRGRHTLLTATSGDTGSAVAHGFLGQTSVPVLLLYPSGKVSPLQEKQMTTLGQNITALEIDGTFDDCQRLVKMAFQDPSLKELGLLSANSINAGRLLPQSFYYFYAAAHVLRRWEHQKQSPPLCFVVPSGNLGNLTGGVLAKKTGCPIDHFIAAANLNDPLGPFLKTGESRTRESITTLSNAMDVANPSNLERLGFFYANSREKMGKEIETHVHSDTETIKTIRQVFDDKHYFIDPHTAVGFAAWKKLKKAGWHFILLSTAHPAKFSEAVQKATGESPPMPPALRVALKKEKESVKLPKDYATLVNWLKQFQRS